MFVAQFAIFDVHIINSICNGVHNECLHMYTLPAANRQTNKQKDRQTDKPEGEKLN